MNSSSAQLEATLHHPAPAPPSTLLQGWHGGPRDAAGPCPPAPPTSHVQTSPWFQVIGTLAMERKDQPKGIWEPPTHSICLLCTL